MRDEFAQLIVQLILSIPLYVSRYITSEGGMHDRLHISASAVLSAGSDHYVPRSIIALHIVTVRKHVCIINFAALDHSFVAAVLDSTGLKFTGDRAQVVSFLRVCEFSSG